MIINNYTDTEELLELDVITKEKKENNIVLFNDDVNTFEWVIECFCKYLKHGSEQAEQCAMLIHTKGKCEVKTGSKSDLKPFKEALVDAGLSAVIE